MSQPQKRSTSFLMSCTFLTGLLGMLLSIIFMPEDAGMAAIVLPWMGLIMSTFVGLIISFFIRRTLNIDIQEKWSKINWIGVGILLFVLFYLFTK